MQQQQRWPCARRLLLLIAVNFHMLGSPCSAASARTRYAYMCTGQASSHANARAWQVGSSRIAVLVHRSRQA